MKTTTLIKKAKSYKLNKGNEEYFVLLMERADNDVVASDGKRIWTWDVLFIGTYHEIFDKICSFASQFEFGEASWKPARKGPEAVIKTLRRALLNPVEKNEFKEGEMIVGYHDNHLSKETFNKLSKFFALPKEEFAPIKTKNVNLLLEFRTLDSQIKKNKSQFPNEKVLLQHIMKNYHNGKFFSEPVKAIFA